MRIRIILPLFRLILAFITAPLILIAWVMICTGERKRSRGPSEKSVKDITFHVYPNMDVLEAKQAD